MEQEERELREDMADLDEQAERMDEGTDELQDKIDKAREESDQLPEEGPGEQVVEDTPGEAREGARRIRAGPTTRVRRPGIRPRMTRPTTTDYID
jgi:chromosome segregation ATPase